MGASLLMSKIVDFNQARSRRAAMETKQRAASEAKDERRTKARRVSGDRLFVQIVNCEFDPELVGTTVSCTARDVSTDGIGILAPRFIPEGCVLDIWLDISTRPGKFFLSSEVRWVRSARNTRRNFELGVQLRDGAATDIAEWRKFQA